MDGVNRNAGERKRGRDNRRRPADNRSSEYDMASITGTQMVRRPAVGRGEFNGECGGRTYEPEVRSPSITNEGDVAAIAMRAVAMHPAEVVRSPPVPTEMRVRGAAAGKSSSNSTWFRERK